MHLNQKHGFTLIELSIVLVIIGLLVGGVLVGRDLIKSAQLRSVISDIDKFNAAANTFQLKYGCLPGDCRNATSLFGQFASCGAWNGIDDFGSNTTCNGNGDGKVVQIAPGDPSAFNWWRYDESMLFWHHLSRAGLISGKYTGMWSDTNGVATGDVPVSKLENGCYSINYSDANSTEINAPYSLMNSSFIALGSFTRPTDGLDLVDCVAGLYSLPAINAKWIDDKLDDGAPFTGTVQTTLDRYGGDWNYSGAVGSYPGCTNENGTTWPYTSTPTIYATAATTTTCQLYFKTKF